MPLNVLVRDHSTGSRHASNCSADDHQPAHRRALAGAGVRFDRPVLRRRPDPHLPGPADLLHGLEPATEITEPRQHEPVDHRFDVRDLLPPLRANLPARTGDRRRPAADGPRLQLNPQSVRGWTRFRLPVALLIRSRSSPSHIPARRAPRTRARARWTSPSPTPAPIRSTTGRSSTTSPCSSPRCCCRTSSSRTR